MHTISANNQISHIIRSILKDKAWFVCNEGGDVLAEESWCSCRNCGFIQDTLQVSSVQYARTRSPKDAFDPSVFQYLRTKTLSGSDVYLSDLCFRSPSSEGSHNIWEALDSGSNLLELGLALIDGDRMSGLCESRGL
jgi:hypothetical protein